MGRTVLARDIPPVPGGIPIDAQTVTELAAHVSAQLADVTPATLAGLIDHTTLKPTDTPDTLDTHLTDALFEPFTPYAVCVTPDYAADAVMRLAGTGVAVASVAGAFPHGRTLETVRQTEISAVLDAGVDELDIVLDRALYLSGAYDAAFDKISWVRDACNRYTAQDGKPRRIKLILETGELPDLAAIAHAAWLSLHAGADMVKTATGTIPEGATPEAVLTITHTVDAFNRVYDQARGIKISGGVATVADATLYYSLTKSVWGDAANNPLRLRFGASRLLNALRTKGT